MGVVDVIESHEDRRADKRGSLEGVTGSTVRNYTVMLDGTDLPSEEAIVALDADGIPEIWDEHPKEPYWFVANKDSFCIKQHYFGVTVFYEYRMNPLDEDPVVRWMPAVSNEPIDEYIDENGDKKPITNSSDESPDPPLTIEVHDMVLHYERNEQYFNSMLASQYRGAVNNDTFYGFPAGKVRCTQIEATMQRVGNLRYWRIVYEFQFRYDGWKRRVLDEGYREKIGTTSEGKPEYKEITDSEGQKVTQPVKLDGEGKRLDEGADAVFLEFDLNKYMPFGALNISPH